MSKRNAERKWSVWIVLDLHLESLAGRLYRVFSCPNGTCHGCIEVPDAC
jgi:hypothetical protein